MRIVSNFKDYYDGVRALDEDRELQYLRLAKSEKLKDYFPKEELYNIGDRDLKNDDNFPFKKIKMAGMKKAVLGFCGKIYSSLVVHYWEKGADETEENIKEEAFLSQIDLDRFLERMEYQGMVQNRYGPYRDDLKECFKSLEYARSFTEKNFMGLFSILNVPCFSIGYTHHKEKVFGYVFKKYVANDIVYVVANPCLKEFGFQRIMSPYECYQELMMYLGGVLKRPEKEMVGISDKVKLRQQGFDEWSFKTLKGDKKPRGSNRGKRE